MKHSLSITLIVVGAALILTPPLVNRSHANNLMKTLSAKQDAGTIYIKEPITQTYALGCWSIGAVMVLLATFSAFSNRAPSDADTRHPSQLKPQSNI